MAAFKFRALAFLCRRQRQVDVLQSSWEIMALQIDLREFATTG